MKKSMTSFGFTPFLEYGSIKAFNRLSMYYKEKFELENSIVRWICNLGNYVQRSLIKINLCYLWPGSAQYLQL